MSNDTNNPAPKTTDSPFTANQLEVGFNQKDKHLSPEKKFANIDASNFATEMANLIAKLNEILQDTSQDKDNKIRTALNYLIDYSELDEAGYVRVQHGEKDNVKIRITKDFLDSIWNHTEISKLETLLDKIIDSLPKTKEERSYKKWEDANEIITQRESRYQDDESLFTTSVGEEIEKALQEQSVRQDDTLIERQKIAEESNFRGELKDELSFFQNRHQYLLGQINTNEKLRKTILDENYKDNPLINTAKTPSSLDEDLILQEFGEPVQGWDDVSRIMEKREAELKDLSNLTEEQLRAAASKDINGAYANRVSQIDDLDQKNQNLQGQVTQSQKIIDKIQAEIDAHEDQTPFDATAVNEQIPFTTALPADSIPMVNPQNTDQRFKITLEANETQIKVAIRERFAEVVADLGLSQMYEGSDEQIILAAVAESIITSTEAKHGNFSPDARPEAVNKIKDKTKEILAEIIDKSTTSEEALERINRLINTNLYRGKEKILPIEKSINEEIPETSLLTDELISEHYKKVESLRGNINKLRADYLEGYRNVLFLDEGWKTWWQRHTRQLREKTGKIASTEDLEIDSEKGSIEKAYTESKKEYYQARDQFGIESMSAMKSLLVSKYGLEPDDTRIQSALDEYRMIILTGHKPDGSISGAWSYARENWDIKAYEEDVIYNTPSRNIVRKISGITSKIMDVVGAPIDHISTEIYKKMMGVKSDVELAFIGANAAQKQEQVIRQQIAEKLGKGAKYRLLLGLATSGASAVGLLGVTTAIALKERLYTIQDKMKLEDKQNLSNSRLNALREEFKNKLDLGEMTFSEYQKESNEITRKMRAMRTQNMTKHAAINLVLAGGIRQTGINDIDLSEIEWSWPNRTAVIERQEDPIEMSADEEGSTEEEPTEALYTDNDDEVFVRRRSSDKIYGNPEVSTVTRPVPAPEKPEIEPLPDADWDPKWVDKYGTNWDNFEKTTPKARELFIKNFSNQDGNYTSNLWLGPTEDKFFSARKWEEFADKPEMRFVVDKLREYQKAHFDVAKIQIDVKNLDKEIQAVTRELSRYGRTFTVYDINDSPRPAIQERNFQNMNDFLNPNSGMMQKNLEEWKTFEKELIYRKEELFNLREEAHRQLEDAQKAAEEAARQAQEEAAKQAQEKATNRTAPTEVTPQPYNPVEAANTEADKIINWLDRLGPGSAEQIGNYNIRRLVSSYDQMSNKSLLGVAYDDPTPALRLLVEKGFGGIKKFETAVNQAFGNNIPRDASIEDFLEKHYIKIASGVRQNLSLEITSKMNLRDLAIMEKEYFLDGFGRGRNVQLIQDWDQINQNYSVADYDPETYSRYFNSPKTIDQTIPDKGIQGSLNDLVQEIFKDKEGLHSLVKDYIRSHRGVNPSEINFDDLLNHHYSKQIQDAYGTTPTYEEKAPDIRGTGTYGIQSRG